MLNRTELVHYLDQYLRIAAIKDYGPQGLHVETHNTTIQRVALAVDVAPPIIHAAAEWGADMLLVHHGLFWRTVEPLVGPLGERVRLLMHHGINLYAAHLPLDAHPEVGNNAVLGQLFGLQDMSWWFEAQGTPLGVVGTVDMPLEVLVAQVNEKLQTTTQVLAHGRAQVSRLAILSGGGADAVGLARSVGADTYLTGETSHAHYWQAADYGLNVLFAGHYATETVGVQALGRHLATQFGLQTRFFDFPTGV